LTIILSDLNNDVLYKLSNYLIIILRGFINPSRLLSYIAIWKEIFVFLSFWAKKFQLKEIWEKFMEIQIASVYIYIYVIYLYNPNLLVNRTLKTTL